MKTILKSTLSKKSICLTIFTFLITNLIYSGSGIEKDDFLNKKINVQLTAFVENSGQFSNECSFFLLSSISNIFILNNGDLVYSDATKGNVLSGNNNIIESYKNSNRFQVFPKSENLRYLAEFYKTTSNVSSYKSRKYESVFFENIYDGIDMDMVVRESTIEKRYFIAPYKDPAMINVNIEGSKLRINDEGTLIFDNEGIQISYSKPIAYQEYDGYRQLIDIRYKVNKDNYGFVIGNYDKSKELIIDPLLGSTYFGLGNSITGNIVLNAMDIDEQGNIYVVGNTKLPNYDDYDVVILKFNKDLTTLLYEIYIAGAGDDYGKDIKIDQNGDIFIAGCTNSSDFPVVQGCFDVTINGSSDMFVCKINNELNYMLGSTYLGGSLDDGGQAVNIDITSSGDVVVSGDVFSPDVPIFGNSYQ